MMMSSKEKKRFSRLVVVGVLVLFLVFAVLNAGLQERVQASVEQEIREVTLEGKVGVR